MPTTPLLALATLFFSAPYETTVKASRPQDAAADVTRITLDDTPLALDGIVSTLQQVPGLQLTRLGGLGAPLWVSLRGSSSAQVAVFLDGVPLGGLAQSSVDLNDLPWGDIAQADVYRGVSPLQFGTGAMGGVLSFSTRVPTQSQVRAGAGYGSFDTFGSDLQGALHLGEDTWHAGLHHIGSAGDFWYRTDGGTAFTNVNDHDVQRVNNALAQSSAFLGGRLRRGHHRLRLWVWGLDRQQGVPSLGIYQARHTRLHNQEITANLAYRLAQPGVGHVEAQVYGQGVRQRYQDPNAEVAPYPSESDDQAGLVGARGYGSWRWLGGWQYAIVAQGRWETLTPRDALAVPKQGATSQRFWGSTGLEVDARFGSVHIVPSVLLEGAMDQRAGRDPFGKFVPATPWRAFLPQGRLAFSQTIGNTWSFRANVARYARLPSPLELYGDSHGTLGNTALLPESGFNADVGAQIEPLGATMPWRVELVFFSALSQDLIIFQENAAGSARAVNLGRARILGADTSLQWQPAHWFQLSGQATYMDARDTSDTPLGQARAQLPNRPRWHLLLQPRFTLMGLHAHIDANYVAGAYLDPANLVVLPNRLVFGASVGWRFTLGDISLRAQNLLDARVFDIAGFPLPSRSLMLTLRLQSLGDTL